MRHARTNVLIIAQNRLNIDRYSTLLRYAPAVHRSKFDIVDENHRHTTVIIHRQRQISFLYKRDVSAAGIFRGLRVKRALLICVQKSHPNSQRTRGERKKLLIS